MKYDQNSGGENASSKEDRLSKDNVKLDLSELDFVGYSLMELAQSMKNTTFWHQ
jgi:hypothetical protein